MVDAESSRFEAAFKVFADGFSETESDPQAHRSAPAAQAVSFSAGARKRLPTAIGPSLPHTVGGLLQLWYAEAGMYALRERSDGVIEADWSEYSKSMKPLDWVEEWATAADRVSCANLEFARGMLLLREEAQASGRLALRQMEPLRMVTERADGPAVSLSAPLEPITPAASPGGSGAHSRVVEALRSLELHDVWLMVEAVPASNGAYGLHCRMNAMVRATLPRWGSIARKEGRWSEKPLRSERVASL